MTAPPAVVLAAGEGTRLRPLTRNRPKPLLPAGTRPILEHVLDTLVDVGVEEIALVVGYKHTRVQDHVGSTYRGASISYVRQETQLGSGHALLQAESAVNGPFLVVNGDQLVAPEIARAVRDGHRDDAVATLAVLDHEAVDQYGGVAVEDGTVADLVERPDDPDPYRLNAGVYAFEDGIFDALRAAPHVGGELALTDGVRTAMERGRTVRATSTSGLWVDATYPWDLLAVARELFAHDVLPDGDGRDGVAPSAQVHDSAVLRGDVAVAADAVVGPGAVLGPNVCLGWNATVEAGAVLENSVLDVDSRVGPNGTVLDCVLGQGVRLGPANVVSGGPADVRVNDRVFSDVQLGAVIADRTETRGDVSVAPGTLVGPEVRVRAGARVDGLVAPGSEVVR